MHIAYGLGYVPCTVRGRDLLTRPHSDLVSNRWSHTYIVVSNYYQILKRPSEGIAERDGAGRTADGAFDLHRPRWMWNRREKARHVKREPGSCKMEPDSLKKGSTLWKGALLIHVQGSIKTHSCKMEPDSLKKGSLGARLIKEWLHFVKREPFSFMFKEV